MQKLAIIISAFLIGIVNVFSQCNGQNAICSKPYNEVAFLTTHNAFNTDSEGFVFPNQNQGIAQQLQDGVRAFMIDVYDLFGNTVVYHGTWTLGYQDIQDDLGEIKLFLDANPNEVITLILECYVSSSTMENELNSSGLSIYLYEKSIGQPWSSLQDMISSNKRLVVFSDQNDATANQGWYHYMWDYMVETHYSVDSPQNFNNEFNRGDSLNELFIFNHFITDANLGIGSESDALVVNDYSFLMNRIEENYSVHQKFPNFVTIDFNNVGHGLQVVEDLNSNFLISDVNYGNDLQCYPNPFRDELLVSLSGSATIKKIHIKDMFGRVVWSGNGSRINTEKFAAGLYVVSVQIEGYVVDKLVLKK